MESASFSQDDVARLSDKDKAELATFIANEQQRTRVSSQTHALTDTCWKKCVAGATRTSKLDKSEETCLTNCVDRFVDMNLLIVKHLSNLRQN